MDQKKYSLLSCFFNHLLRGFFLITPLRRFLVDLTQKENFEINWPLLKMNLFFFSNFYLANLFICKAFPTKKMDLFSNCWASLYIHTNMVSWAVPRSRDLMTHPLTVNPIGTGQEKSKGRTMCLFLERPNSAVYPPTLLC